MSRIQGMTPALDYSKEAKKLWEKLGINPDQINEGRGYNLVDVIFRSPEGGSIYVGGERAARDLEMLREKKITTVVNCTDDLRNYHEKFITYYTFNIAWWRRSVGDSQKELQDFILPVLEFIEKEVKSGHNVLIHCLAGAHRAGTTAILCLMHLAGLDCDKAITTAKSLRSMIEPIGDFRQLLTRCDGMQRSVGGKFTR
eukprot:TRINITY_DN32250_c0_g1_i1.p1 TRINITY_DN32250_c0_g1~~TRINITY_DN32250_c0_g1_i1.p1  ORF type:complete len:216 (-),score=71.98 TRINITY_DN32250_c0_g1_i1:97-693(-)